MPDPRPTTVLTPIEIDAALNFFLYYMTIAQRSTLMSEYPTIYNRLMGKSIVRVVRNSDDSDVSGDTTQGSE